MLTRETRMGSFLRGMASVVGLFPSQGTELAVGSETPTHARAVVVRKICCTGKRCTHGRRSFVNDKVSKGDRLTDSAEVVACKGTSRRVVFEVRMGSAVQAVLRDWSRLSGDLRSASVRIYRKDELTTG